MHLLFKIAAIALLVGATQPAVSNRPASDRPEADRGRQFAQAHCSACHAVERLTLSSNPEAPPFDLIVNRQEVTMDTLKTFLGDSHNFPEVMDFEIEPQNIDDLAAYLMTLKDRAEAKGGPRR